jgi:hypothetical protein
MEVHAHTHTERKKWTHYFWEFLMLFLAVFCGFLAENIREHKVEHKRANEYAEMMKEDLMKDTAQLGGLVRGTDAMKLAEKIYNRVYETPVDNITLADMLSLEDPGIEISSFQWNDASYSQLKSSGNLRLFTDKKLIRKIALYESNIKSIAFFENSIQNMLLSDYTLRAGINKKKFLINNPELGKEGLLKKAGYNFEFWKEGGAINQKIISYELILHMIYPEINKIATEIIELLKKEYHLSETTPLGK